MPKAALPCASENEPIADAANDNVEYAVHRELSRRRALARVFRLWADQVHGNLQAIRAK